ncbi:MAG TPA: hypothetical protein VGK87_13905 [Anaerolineae bacterium]|jgi:hypothetical protein
MDQIIEPDARVLVCLMNTPRDLEIARWDHWYRIPVKHAPPDFLADIIAFYLASAFDDEKWAIHEYAHVRGHELVRRCDMFPDQPNHPRANDLYYKMQLGPLLRLARPIPSLRWRRIAFIETTGDRLLHALEISELVESRSEASRFVQLMEDDF